MFIGWSTSWLGSHIYNGAATFHGQLFGTRDAYKYGDPARYGLQGPSTRPQPPFPGPQDRPGRLLMRTLVSQRVARGAKGDPNPYLHSFPSLEKRPPFSENNGRHHGIITHCVTLRVTSWTDGRGREPPQ